MTKHFKNIVLMALVLAGVNLIGLAQSKDSENGATAAEHRLNDALLRGDWRTVEQLFGDDLIFTNPDGLVTGKLEEVNSVKSGDEKLEFIKMSDVKVQNLGDVAVVTGNLVEKGSYKAADLSGSYRFTDVWVNRAGRWQLVAGQETLYTPAK